MNRKCPPRNTIFTTFNPYIGARAFAVAGPKAWNQLPAHLRTLKTALKTYLYSTQWLLQIVWTRRALVMTLFMLRRVRNNVGAITITPTLSPQTTHLLNRWQYHANSRSYWVAVRSDKSVTRYTEVEKERVSTMHKMHIFVVTGRCSVTFTLPTDQKPTAAATDDFYHLVLLVRRL